MSPADREAEASAEIGAARALVSAALQTILDAAETALRAEALPNTAKHALQAIVIACATEDIAGQRLGRAMRLLQGRAEDPLLRGPAFVGEGLDQAAADALFAPLGGGDRPS